MKASIRSVLAILALTLPCVPGTAQSLLGTVSGSVKDEQGGALPGAVVTLSGKTGSKTAPTDAAGVFRFVAVEPGTYSVSAELGGFAPKRVDNISVTIGKTVATDFVLKIGGLTDSVEAVAEAPIVDTSTTATDNSLSQELLFNLPLNRFAPDLLNYTPGVNSGAAFGGGSDVSNGLYIDGVDSRDPSAGTAWVFPNFNIVEEVQVQGLGANAEYGSFTGAVVNTITRSGGNTTAGLFDIQYSGKSLGGDNITQELLAQNPDLGNAAKTTKHVDFTAQLSGPMIQDKLFYFFSAQRLETKSNPPGPIESDSELSPRFNGKLTWLPSGNDTVSLGMQYDQYNVTGRAGWDSLIETQDVTVGEEAPELVYNLQWRHLFGSNTFLEAKFAGWNGYYDLFPNANAVGKSVHYDVTDNTYTESAGYRFLADRNRNQLNASLTHYADKWGKHELKFGLEIERSSAQNRSSYENGIYYYDSTAYYPRGQYYGFDSSYDFKTNIARDSFFAQDNWKPTSRLTVTAGVRLDRGRGSDGGSQDIGKVYEFTAVAPRIGIAVDVTGDQKTVLKAHYGDFVDSLSGTYFRRAVPGLGPYIGYFYNPDGTGEFVGPEGNTFDVVNRVDYPVYNVDPDLKHPRVNQYTATLERALSSDTRIAVTGTYRKWKNFVDTTLPDARWSRFEVTNNLTNQPLEVYRLIDQAATENFLITNVDGTPYFDADGNLIGTADAKRNYKSIMVVLNKRFSHRWQAQVSYVWSKTEGTVDNDGNGTRTSNFISPNRSLINADGLLSYDRTHEFKVLGSVLIPKIDVSIAPYWRTISGFPLTALQTVSRSATNLPFALVSSTARTVRLEPRGSRKTSLQNKLDIRVEKVFKLGGSQRLAAYGDIFNVFNTNYDFDLLTNVASENFGSPGAITAPRQVFIGARWSF
jgi:Carboxypeptidase regulatory-like domain/TonB dependent receptor-like, beta-barrel